MRNMDQMSIGQARGISTEISDLTLSPGQSEPGLTVRQFRTAKDLGGGGYPFLGAHCTVQRRFEVACDKAQGAQDLKARGDVPKILWPLAWVAVDGVDVRRGVVGDLAQALPFEMAWTDRGIVRYVRSLKGEPVNEGPGAPSAGG